MRPFWERVYGEERLQLPGLPEFVQALWEMGVYPDVEMLATRRGGRFHSWEEAREVLRTAPGILVIDKHEPGGYITPHEAAGEDATYISRIREDATVENGLAFWCVSDNLRKGAALNAIQIAEVLVNRKLIQPRKQAA